MAGGHMKPQELFLDFLSPLDGALGLKKKAQGMAIQCTFNPLLNRERHLVGSENKENGSCGYMRLHLAITSESTYVSL